MGPQLEEYQASCLQQGAAASPALPRWCRAKACRRNPPPPEAAMLIPEKGERAYASACTARVSARCAIARPLAGEAADPRRHANATHDELARQVLARVACMR